MELSNPRYIKGRVHVFRNNFFLLPPNALKSWNWGATKLKLYRRFFRKTINKQKFYSFDLSFEKGEFPSS